MVIYTRLVRQKNGGKDGKNKRLPPRDSQKQPFEQLRPISG